MKDKPSDRFVWRPEYIEYSVAHCQSIIDLGAATLDARLQ